MLGQVRQELSGEDPAERTYMILHFVRPLVTSLRIRISSHAFNPSKHATARGRSMLGDQSSLGMFLLLAGIKIEKRKEEVTQDTNARIL